MKCEPIGNNSKMMTRKFHFQTKRTTRQKYGDEEEDEEKIKSKLGMICYVGNKFSAKIFHVVYSGPYGAQWFTPVRIIANGWLPQTSDKGKSVARGDVCYSWAYLHFQVHIYSGIGLLTANFLSTLYNGHSLLSSLQMRSKTRQLSCQLSS